MGNSFCLCMCGLVCMCVCVCTCVSAHIYGCMFRNNKYLLVCGFYGHCLGGRIYPEVFLHVIARQLVWQLGNLFLESMSMEDIHLTSLSGLEDLRFSFVVR